MLVVAATPLELSSLEGIDTLACGVGPVEAALATVRALERSRPDAVLHIGIAGARELAPGALVLGSEAVYCDAVDPASSYPRITRVSPAAALLESARQALPEAHVLPIATAARLGGGGTCCEVEAMEGFGVLRAAFEAGVPALELRAVSNRFDDVRSEWRIDVALDALAAGVARLREALRA